MKLPALRTAVLYQECLPVPLGELLAAWPALDTLVLGDLSGDDIVYADLAAMGAGVRNLHFHDFEAEGADGDAALAALPAHLESLRIDYSLGMSLRGVAQYLPRATRLRELAFVNQLRGSNGAADVLACVRAASGLRRMELGLVRYPRDAHDAVPFGAALENATLEELVWRGVYMDAAAAGSGEDELVELVVASVDSLPKLRLLRVGATVRGGGDGVEMYAGLRAVCARDDSAFTDDAAKVGAGGKRVLVVFEDDAGFVDGPTAASMKLGEDAEEGAVCGVFKVEDEEEKECTGEWEA